MARNGTPDKAFTLMHAVYRNVFPAVEKELSVWQTYAADIPEIELRKQALASINTKRFHCLGGSVYALLAGADFKEAIRFIVSYQTICDYLDNLCDRSTSSDPDDFRKLHQALFDAFTPENPVENYYALRSEQRDGGYLPFLVRTCQRVIARHVRSDIRPVLRYLAALYTDLQVHKHVTETERIERLTSWYKEKRTDDKTLSWYEFSAACGSTLGIFCTVAYAIGGKMSEQIAKHIFNGYFPYVQGLHILMDYYIDQHEDENERDLNFCMYYPDDVQMKNRFVYFIRQANIRVKSLPDPEFHQLICRGLVGLYLADPKTASLAGSKQLKKALFKTSGRFSARFFHWNAKMYHQFKKK